MPVAVNINNQNIKMLVFEKGQLARWETVELPVGLVKDGQILQPAAVAGILNELFESAKLRRDGVIVSLTGMSYIYRILTLPKLKSADLPEAILRATQKEINVPIDELYIDWQKVGEKADSQEIFVLGAPRLLVDALANTFKQANIKLTSLELNSLALARLVNQPKAVIADFGRDWFDIVIVAGGVPVTLHSVAPKGNLREFEDDLSQINDEIRRTVDFFNLTHKENPIQPDQAIVLSGIRKSAGAEGALIEKYLPYATASLNGHVAYPEGFSPSEYAVPLGLMLKFQAGKASLKISQALYQDINLNLLAVHSRIRPNQLSLKKLAAPAAIVAEVVILIPLLLMRGGQVAENRNLQANLDWVNRNLNIRRMNLSQAEVNQAQVSQLLNDTQTVQNERAMISGQGDLSQQLLIVFGGLTVKLNYTGVVSNAAQIIVDGQAESRADMLEYTAYLESQKVFAEVRIATIEDLGPSEAATGLLHTGRVAFRIILER